MTADNGQDELSKRIALEIKSLAIIPSEQAVKEGAMSWEQIVEYKTGKIMELVAHHTQEAVEAAREKAIDDCIAVVRNKQLEDAEELAKRMSELSASQQSTSPNGDIKDGGVLDHGAGMEAWENP